MATGKRYYWIKLKESFMTSDAVDYLMSQPNGANYVVLYQMLCLKTINTDGRLSRQIGEIIIPYDIDKIQRDCKWFSADTIRVALNLYKAFGLIYEDVDGTLIMADHDSLVGSETDYAAKARRIRANQQNRLPAGGRISGHNVSTDVSGNATTDIRDRDKDIRDKDIRDQISDKEDVESTAPETATVLTLTLNDKSEYPITQDDIDAWAELYPAVDILQELRKMRGWCDANPRKRKTKSGIRRFIASWLAREQDRGGTPARRGCTGSGSGRGNELLDMIAKGEFDDSG